MRLEVSDTGYGMTEDVKARIFDPFFTTRFAGHGLRPFRRSRDRSSHGGSIEVDSAPGKGSRFVLLLPCAGRHSTRVVSPVPARQHATPGGAVLLIEDEDSFRSVVAKLLRKRGFQVIDAADGMTAVETMKSDPARISVVVLDLTLPGMSGTEVFDELRRIKPDLKVVISTAYSRETIASDFAGRDIRGFIRKPYQIDELAELLLQVSGS